jgi:dienelactone hydrolase
MKSRRMNTSEKTRARSVRSCQSPIVKTDFLDYADGALSCRGVLFHEDAQAAKHPGVVLFPDARGIGETAKACAARLAGCGFTVLVADLYGNGAFAAEVSDAHTLMGALRGDVDAWRRRAKAALDALAAVPSVDGRLAAIGYCFGGTTALELARSGEALAAVVSFHGGLATARPEDAANIQGKVLVCHGAADPLVPPQQVADFVAQMAKARVDWHFHSYAGVVHAFTNPDAGDAGTPAFAYDAHADRHSWQAMMALFDEVFAIPASSHSSPASRGGTAIGSAGCGRRR